MIIYSVQWGPYDTGYDEEVSGVFTTDQGEKEFYFDNFTEFYDFTKHLSNGPVEMNYTADVIIEDYPDQLVN